MKRIASLLPIFLMTAAPQALSETLEEAWAVALASHYQIAAAGAERDAADMQLERARSARMPSIGIGSAYTKLDEAPGFSFGDGLSTGPIFENDQVISANAQLSVPLYVGGAINAGIEAAEYQANAASGQLGAVIQDTKLRIAEHYVGVLRAESAVAVAESTVASLASHTRDTRNRFESGAVPRNDYLASAVTLADAEQRLLQAKNGLDLARASYNRALGRPLADNVSLDPLLRTASILPAGTGLPELMDLARSERDELDVLRAQTLALRKQSDAARAGTRPQFALTGGYTYLDNAFLTDDQFWTAGVSFQWNIFDGGKSRKQAATLDRRAQSMEYRRADVESLIDLEVRQAWNDRLEAENRLAVVEAAVQQAEENLRVVGNRYGAGASTNAEVLDAQFLRTRSLSNRDDARFEVHLATLRLARAVGAL